MFLIMKKGRVTKNNLIVTNLAMPIISTVIKFWIYNTCCRRCLKKMQSGRELFQRYVPGKDAVLQQKESSKQYKILLILPNPLSVACCILRIRNQKNLLLLRYPILFSQEILVSPSMIIYL